ncbi:hypothetical protein QCA50_013691 [Cerrena zonata]|uniref:F-box domain-containing protein n=1 Tax=Cerrena zonata TaxID=2478898 RepID=A0AAW0FXV4_9APHY
MNSIPTILDDFLPDVVKPGTSFDNLTAEEIHSRIKSHEKIVLKLRNLLIHHMRAIARYSSSLNEIVPSINKLLPPEILSEIFLYYRRMCGTQGLPCVAWLKVAHVCRLWRNIVLANPLFFTTFRIPMPKSASCTTEFLRLSKQLPLHLILSSKSPPSRKELTPFLSRARTLKIDTTLCQGVARWKWPCFPVLSSFEYPTDLLTRVTFDRDISEIMPNLQYLNTGAYLFCRGWSSHSLPRTLKTLILSYVGREILDRYVHDILPKLVELPQLEDLRLIYGRDYDTPPSNQIGSHISHLKYLHVEASLSTILLLLDHVSLADRVDLTITGGTKDMWLMLPSMLQSKLTPAQPNPSSIRMKHTFEVNVEKQDRVSFLYLLTADEDGTPSIAGADTSHHIRIGAFCSAFIPSRIFTFFVELLADALSSHWKLVPKCQLWFNESSGGSTDCGLAMQTILHGIPSTTTLDITLPHPIKSTNDGSEYFDALLPSVFLTLDQKDGLILPNLQELNVEMYIPYLWSNDLRPYIPDTLLRNLGDALRERKKENMELRVLTLKAPEMPSEGWKQLDESGSLFRVRSLVGDFVIIPSEEV